MLSSILVYWTYMPRASRKEVNRSLQIEMQDNFALLISSLSSSRDIQQFFQTFLTDEEKTMLTKRLMLHLMLENYYDPAEISTVLGFSRETVYKHKIIWITGGDVYKTVIKKIAGKTKTKDFWKKVEKFLRPLELALISKSNMRARAKFMSGDYE